MTSVLVDYPEDNARLLQRLQRALDVGAVRDVLNREWAWAGNRGLHVAEVRVHRVFPRGTDRFIVKYHITTHGESGIERMTVFGELVAGSVAELCNTLIAKLQKSRRKQLERYDDADALCVLDELEMLLRIPGFDDKLPGLMILHQPKTARAILRQFGGRTKHFGKQPRFEILNHRPGKRCVLLAKAFDDYAAKSIVVRCLKQDRDRHRINAEQIEQLRMLGFGDTASDGIFIPKTLGYSDELASVAIEYVAGSILGEGSPMDSWHQAQVSGLALAKLHATPLSIASRYGPEHELSMLDNWVSLIVLINPDLGAELHAALQRIVKQMAALPAFAPRLLHRDYYYKQLLHDGEHTYMIDFDTLCIGDPAIDIANYLAHEELAALTGSSCAVIEDEFLLVYSRRLQLPQRTSLAVWKNAALLRLACLYACRTGWEHVPCGLLKKIRV